MSCPCTSNQVDESKKDNDEMKDYVTKRFNKEDMLYCKK